MVNKSEAEKTGMLSNILAVTGLVILIAIISWGVVRMGALSGSWLLSFSSLLSPSSKSIRVTVPSNKILSGEQFAVSWKHAPKAAGSYALLYQCREGFQFKTSMVDEVQTPIPCGVGYTMISANNTFNVIPILASTSSLDVPLSIIFIPSAPAATGTPVSQAQGNASVTIINAANTSPAIPAAAPATTAETSPVPDAKTADVPSARVPGLPDLSVRILSEGVIEPVSGNIIARSPTSPDDLVAVRFLISNAGGSATGPWYFTAQLPTSPAYPYASPVQVPLAPGASIENMLRFKNAVPGGVFSVSVDPANQVNESNGGNNTAVTNI